MPRPKDNKKKSNDYRGGSALLKKQQEENTKKYKAMTPAQKKTYIAKQAKSVGKGVVQVASMVGGAGLVRKGGVAAARKLVPAKKVISSCYAGSSVKKCYLPTCSRSRYRVS